MGIKKERRRKERKERGKEITPTECKYKISHDVKQPRVEVLISFIEDDRSLQNRVFL